MLTLYGVATCAGCGEGGQAHRRRLPEAFSAEEAGEVAGLGGDGEPGGGSLSAQPFVNLRPSNHPLTVAARTVATSEGNLNDVSVLVGL